MNASQLRAGSSKFKVQNEKLRKNDVYIILDDVLDTYNIGAIFRLADGVAVKKIILCGKTATPPDHKIKKASINTTEWVEWEYAPDAVGAIKSLKLKVQNLKVAAIEQSEKSVPYTEFDYSLPIAFVVGHESYGVSKQVLELCDGIVELPMYGVNVSLNVMVSLGIVIYHVLNNQTS